MGDKVEDTFHISTEDGKAITDSTLIEELVNDIETSIDELHESL